MKFLKIKLFFKKTNFSARMDLIFDSFFSERIFSKIASMQAEQTLNFVSSSAKTKMTSPSLFLKKRVFL
jgi:hypothetical protein